MRELHMMMEVAASCNKLTFANETSRTWQL